MRTIYKKLRTDYFGRSVQAEIIGINRFGLWKDWAAEETGRKLYPLGVAWDVCSSSNLYDLYAVDKDDDAPRGGCTGYIAIPLTFDCEDLPDEC